MIKIVCERLVTNLNIYKCGLLLLARAIIWLTYFQFRFFIFLYVTVLVRLFLYHCDVMLSNNMSFVGVLWYAMNDTF